MQFPTLPLCSQCGYGTISPPSEIASNFKAPNSNSSPFHLAGQTGQHAFAISQWLPEARRGLAEYNKELNRLRAFLIELECIRDDFQQCIDKNLALISPVRRLPFEVLTEIFSLSCAQNAEDLSAAGAQRTESLIYPAGRTALRLSLVCSRWRGIALHTPEMWSVINVSVRNHLDLPSLLSKADNGDCVDYFRPLVELYLKRSLDRPLAITVYCPSKLNCTPQSSHSLSPNETLCDVLLPKIFLVLVKESRRWRTALINLAHGPDLHRSYDDYDMNVDEFAFQHDDDSTESTSAISDDDALFHMFVPPFHFLEAPLLEFLDICCGSMKTSFSNATRLHTLAITGTPKGQPVQSVMLCGPLQGPLISAPGLRSLTLREYGICELGIIFPLLESDPGLVDVRLEDFYYYEEEEDTCRAPAIKSLSVYLDKHSVRSLRELCLFLIVEHVTSLEFEYRLIEELDFGGSNWYDRRAFPLEDLMCMIKCSNMSLRVLKIDGFTAWDEELVELLEMLPDLEVLHLAEIRIKSEMARIEEIDLGDEVMEDEDEEAESSRSPFDDSTKLVSPRFLRKLTIPSIATSAYRPPLLPNLNSLSLTFHPHSQLQKLLKMIRSRWCPELTVDTFESASEVLSLESDCRPGVSLKSIAMTLILDPLADFVGLKDFRDGLRELRNEGLDVVHKVIVYEQDPLVSRVCDKLQGEC